MTHKYEDECWMTASLQNGGYVHVILTGQSLAIVKELSALVPHLKLRPSGDIEITLNYHDFDGYWDTVKIKCDTLDCSDVRCEPGRIQTNLEKVQERFLAKLKEANIQLHGPEHGINPPEAA